MDGPKKDSDERQQPSLHEQVAQHIKEHPSLIARDIMAVGYLPEAGTFYYPRVSYKEAENSIRDKIGFFQRMEEILPKRITSESLIGFIDDLNKFYKGGVRIIVVDPVEPRHHETINVEINGKVEEIFNNLDDNTTGMHNGKGVFLSEYQGDEHNPTGVVYHYAMRGYDRPTDILINRRRLFENPVRTLIVLAHEIGHAEEDLEETEITFQGERFKSVSPATEVMATLYGIKMGELLYQHSPDPLLVEYIAEHVKLYNQVIFGNPTGIR